MGRIVGVRIEDEALLERLGREGNVSEYIRRLLVQDLEESRILSRLKQLDRKIDALAERIDLLMEGKWLDDAKAKQRKQTPSGSS